MTRIRYMESLILMQKYHSKIIILRGIQWPASNHKGPAGGAAGLGSDRGGSTQRSGTSGEALALYPAGTFDQPPLYHHPPYQRVPFPASDRPPYHQAAYNVTYKENSFTSLPSSSQLQSEDSAKKVWVRGGPGTMIAPLVDAPPTTSIATPLDHPPRSSTASPHHLPPLDLAHMQAHAAAALPPGAAKKGPSPLKVTGHYLELEPAPGAGEAAPKAAGPPGGEAAAAEEGRGRARQEAAVAAGGAVGTPALVPGTAPAEQVRAVPGAAGSSGAPVDPLAGQASQRSWTSPRAGSVSGSSMGRSQRASDHLVVAKRAFTSAKAPEPALPLCGHRPAPSLILPAPRSIPTPPATASHRSQEAAAEEGGAAVRRGSMQVRVPPGHMGGQVAARGLDQDWSIDALEFDGVALKAQGGAVQSEAWLKEQAHAAAVLSQDWTRRLEEKQEDKKKQSKYMMDILKAQEKAQESIVPKSPRGVLPGARAYSTAGGGETGERAVVRQTATRVFSATRPHHTAPGPRPLNRIWWSKQLKNEEKAHQQQLEKEERASEPSNLHKLMRNAAALSARIKDFQPPPANPSPRHPQQSSGF